MELSGGAAKAATAPQSHADQPSAAQPMDVSERAAKAAAAPDAAAAKAVDAPESHADQPWAPQPMDASWRAAEAAAALEAETAAAAAAEAEPQAASAPQTAAAASPAQPMSYRYLSRSTSAPALVQTVSFLSLFASQEHTTPGSYSSEVTHVDATTHGLQVSI